MNIPQDIKPIILGLSGLALTAEEKEFFLEHKPVGFILFARNIDDKKQVKDLVSSLTSLFDDFKPLILIDQEGGRVARLKPPHWKEYPPAGTFSALARVDLEGAKKTVYVNYNLIGQDLRELGINVDCAPVLDLLIEGSHDIVGDRAFGSKPEQVIELGRSVCDGLIDAGVLPVIKHIPGHGRANVDSHESLPVVDDDFETLKETDFVPFKALADMPIAMTAHIKYTDIDDQDCGTLSSKVIDLIRNEIGFDGLLLTDDLSMKALEGSFAYRTEKSFEAGCDIVLHCNGDMEEMKYVVSATPKMSDTTKSRLSRALDLLKK